MDWGEVEVDTDRTFEEGSVCIMDSRGQVLRRKTVRLVRVLWKHRGGEESTWECTWVSRLIFKLLVYMHGRVHVAYACVSE